jgi:hypothetical protein
MRQWVGWRHVLKNGRWTKVPVDPRTGRNASVSDPNTWGTFDEACAAIERFGLDGLGLVLTDDGGIVGIDLDDCFTDAGSLSPLAAEIIGYGETYAEISPSGGGIRLFVLGEIAAAIKNDALGVEVYGNGRYLTVTGNHLGDTPNEIRAAPRTLQKLHDAVEAARRSNGAKPNGHAQASAGDDLGSGRAGDHFFANVNAAALAKLDAWVSALHPTARKHATGAWRVTSQDLGRGLEEDIAYHPNGIRDHGEEHGLTPIDAVLRYGDAVDAKAAAMWLCQKMGIEPASLGWRGYANGSAGPRIDAVHVDDKRGEEAEALNVKPWPILDSTAAYGLVGEMAKLATENSEADPVAVMLTALVRGAATLGRNRFMNVGDSVHHPRIFTVLVGASSRARKGTSTDPVTRFYEAAERKLQSRSTLTFPSGLSLKVSPGPLSSGEGLIDAIRDKMEMANGQEDLGGTDDKRLLCIEGEFGAVLRACQRQGNTLSTVLRVAWDGLTLAPLTKNNKIVASRPHICLLAHVTQRELRELLTAVDVWNGFANRFLWCAVRRCKVVPFPTPMADGDVDRVGFELARIIEYAHSRTGSSGRLVMSNAAQSHWVDCYPELTQDHAGILGAVTSRAEAQALRLAITFALLDGADRIELKHVEAALAIWRYAFDSAAFIFGGAEIDPVGQRILEDLRPGPKTQEELGGLFGRHLPKGRLETVLADLQERGRITLTIEKTAGRPRRVWRLA